MPKKKTKLSSQSNRQTLYMVIRSDNYGRSGEHPGFDESIVDAGPYPRNKALQIAIDLNNSTPLDDWYYTVQPVGYKLVVWED